MNDFFSKKPNLDKTAENFLENLSIDKPLYEMTPEEARNFLSKIQKKYYFDVGGEIETIEIFDDEIGAVTIKLVRPIDCAQEKLPIILYCHGGGWVMGDFEVYDMTVKTIAQHAKAAVAFVEYPRSPEYPYPNALNQIYRALQYLWENADKHNLDREHIAIVGDSAGGNMAITTAVRAKNKIKFLALLYPVCSSDMNTGSYKEFQNGPWLSKKAMEWFWQAYVPDKSQRHEPSISPLNNDLEALEGLSPTLILTAENDVLRDEGEMFARKLIEAGVETACIRINNTFHDFLMLNGLRDSMAVKAAYKVLCKFLYHKLR